MSRNTRNETKPAAREAKVVRASAHASSGDSLLTSTAHFGDMVQVNPAPDASTPAVPSGVYREFKVCR